jgi:2-keto-4-pentenoate hydratase
MSGSDAARQLDRHLAPTSVISGEPAGWKAALGMSRALALGLRGPLVGRLAADGVHQTGVEIAVAGWTSARVEPEIAVRLGRDVRAGATQEEIWDCVAAIMPAFELVDVTGGFEDVDAMLHTNIYHRVVVIGDPVDPAALGDRPVQMRLTHEGETLGESADAGAAVGGIHSVVAHIARVLAASGERMSANDLVMTGTVIVPPEIERAGIYTADFGALGVVGVRVGSA